MIVGLILARAGASEDTIVAGILNDTMEDSVAEKKVTKEMIAERFGTRVADIVESVSQPNKELSWEERKEEAYHHIAGMAHESLLVKSADLISNISDMITDHRAEGDDTFSRFNAPLEKIIAHYMRMIDAIGKKWPGNPLNEDLQSLKVAPMFARML